MVCMVRKVLFYCSNCLIVEGSKDTDIVLLACCFFMPDYVMDCSYTANLSLHAGIVGKQSLLISQVMHAHAL